MSQRDFDADKAAQEVVNASGANFYAGNGKHLSEDFKALFDRTCAYVLRQTSLTTAEKKVC